MSAHLDFWFLRNRLFNLTPPPIDDHPATFADIQNRLLNMYFQVWFKSIWPIMNYSYLSKSALPDLHVLIITEVHTLLSSLIPKLWRLAENPRASSKVCFTYYALCKLSQFWVCRSKCSKRQFCMVWEKNSDRKNTFNCTSYFPWAILDCVYINTNSASQWPMWVRLHQRVVG